MFRSPLSSYLKESTTSLLSGRFIVGFLALWILGLSTTSCTDDDNGTSAPDTARAHISYRAVTTQYTVPTDPEDSTLLTRGEKLLSLPLVSAAVVDQTIDREGRATGTVDIEKPVSYPNGTIGHLRFPEEREVARIEIRDGNYRFLNQMGEALATETQQDD